jgi:hypothetical protein
MTWMSTHRGGVAHLVMLLLAAAVAIALLLLSGDTPAISTVLD